MLSKRQALILLVGYFVLGPSDLYKLVKEIGKFIQNIRTLGTDLSTTLESNMESQLQLEELRKAQRELNDAFSFRRSINVDSQGEAFSTTAGNIEDTKEPAAAASEATEEATTTTAPPRKIRRRVKKKTKQDTLPDFEMPSTSTTASSSSTAEATTKEGAKSDGTTTTTTTREKNGEDSSSSMTAEEVAEIEQEFAKYTEETPEEKDAAATRFQQQMSGDWNQQILDNTEKLEPLTAVMNKIALLEKEKQAATARLGEEFQKRTELEEEYYRQQRELLEEAAQQVQEASLGLDKSSSSSSKI